MTKSRYKPQSTYRGRGETGGVYMPSQMERIPQLVMVDRVKERGWAWAAFTLMMECTPESGHCHSVYSVVQTLLGQPPNDFPP